MQDKSTDGRRERETLCVHTTFFIVRMYMHTPKNWTNNKKGFQVFTVHYDNQSLLLAD
jgi:hypothetical protein